MEPQVEKLVKLLLLFILLLGILMFWLIPKTRLRSKLKMNDNLYKLTQIVGMICGISGLVCVFFFPHWIIELHLWELIIMPYVVIQVYWGMVIKVSRNPDWLDEKQDYDMTKAGGHVFAASIPAMIILYMLYYNEILSGLIWFPYYLFISILVFSSSIYYSFAKN
jgi:hypothetical protein